MKRVYITAKQLQACMKRNTPEVAELAKKIAIAWACSAPGTTYESVAARCDKEKNDA